MSGHNPGPWRWEVVAGEDQLLDADGNFVIEAQGFMCGSEDARLIAAAPELLDLIERLIHRPPSMGGSTRAVRMHRLHAEARSLLARIKAVA